MASIRSGAERKTPGAVLCRSARDRTMLDLQMLDITAGPMEVAPTAHYSMGGVWVEPEEHRTDVAGLYAIGEAASGLHGANRLGGNSLIELMVYGRITGRAAAAFAKGSDAPTRDVEAVAGARAEIEALLSGDGTENARRMQRDVRAISPPLRMMSPATSSSNPRRIARPRDRRYVR